MNKNINLILPTPFYMRWFASQKNSKGLNLGRFSLSVRFSFEPKRAEATKNTYMPLEQIYRTFVFFADETRHSITPTANNIYPDIKVLPQSIYNAILEAATEICKNAGTSTELLKITYPVDKIQADNFEIEANMQANEFARYDTENRAHARKLSNTAQSGLNNDVLYIS
jgi:hypothetical protein